MGGVSGSWMYEQRIPRAKSRAALEYFRQLYKSKVVAAEGQILNTMPPAMRSEFSVYIYAKFVCQVPIFRGLPSALINAICCMCQPMIAVCNQVVLQEGSSGTEMYIVLSGEMEISHQGQRLGFLSDGAFFGEVAAACLTLPVGAACLTLPARPPAPDTSAICPPPPGLG